MIVLPKFAIIGNNRSGNFGRSIFPTHAFDFQHIALFYPLELFPFVVIVSKKGLRTCKA